MGLASSCEKSLESASTPCLMTSPQESVSSSWLMVDRQVGSATTTLGCQKAPARFFPASRSMAVFPPTDESTMARRLVGTWATEQPLM